MTGDSDMDSPPSGPSRNNSHGDAHQDVPDNSAVPKPKRLACMICRKRKLKCDGVRPSCSTCSRLGHSCAYDEQRRKSGPKRGYVKALEERLKQVETMLKTQDQPNTANSSPTNVMGAGVQSSRNGQSAGAQPIPAVPGGTSMGMATGGDEQWNFNSGSPQPGASMDEFSFGNGIGMSMNNVAGNFTWEMIGLGLEEPLPPQDTIDELHQIYFEKVYPSMPMIHKYRYLAAMNLAPNQRPPVCLRYAMWTMACSLTAKYRDLTDLFYTRARKYAEADYMKGYGEHMISVAHCQTHCLLSNYEMKMLYFPRAWMSTGAAIRLAQMTGLHRQDGGVLDVKQCLPPPKDWTEREERRRTFWMAFCGDRYASIGTGWPMSIDERDITTNMPSSDEAYEMGRPENTTTLEECMSSGGASKLSSFGGIVVMSCLFGRNLVHLHRPGTDDQDHDINGAFWKRHRQLDHIILDTSLCLPSSLKFPAGINNPNVIFTNMAIHTSTICLHQAAIYKAEKFKLPASVSAESKVRCITAANEITSIMRTISHMDLSAMNPFMVFSLYVAARVYVQFLKSRPDDSQTADALRFLLSAMNALKRANSLTESFLVQLEVDFEALADRIPKLREAFGRMTDSPADAQKGKGSGSGGPVCDDPNGIQGIMAYRNECHFLKVPGDTGNIASAPELVDSQGSGAQADAARSGQANGQAPEPAGTTHGSWLNAEHPIRLMTPNSGSMYERFGSGTYPVHGFGSNANGDSQDVSVDEAQSNSRATPNSSGGASESRIRLAPGPMSSSGHNSFQASPIMPQQSMMNGGGMDTTDPALFGDATGFTMGSEMSGQQGLFGTGSGWEDMQGQTGMTPDGDGVLRALINMAPMDTMDLSSWDTGHANLR